MSVEAKEKDLFAAWERINARQEQVGFAGLEHGEQMFIAIWELEADVNQNGFSGWMFNSAGEHAELAVAGLRELGAGAAANVCERFFALLPGGRPAPDQNGRQAQLEAAEAQHGEDEFEDACSELERDFYALEDDLRDRLFELIRT
jgi:hypothetical protein